MIVLICCLYGFVSCACVVLSVRGVRRMACVERARTVGVRRERVVVLNDTDEEATGKKILISREIVGSWRWECWE